MLRRVALVDIDIRGNYRHHHQGDKNRFLCSVLLLLVTANFISSSPILINLMK
jgi:hypothetical protein